LHAADEAKVDAILERTEGHERAGGKTFPVLPDGVLILGDGLGRGHWFLLFVRHRGRLGRDATMAKQEQEKGDGWKVLLGVVAITGIFATQ
jgi:hypothetical protein